MQILDAGHTAFAWGFGVGAGLGALMVWVDSPPERIDRWRRGAQGEKDTARALRPLVRQGWHVFNDIDIRHGNIDHVLIGPPGVFVLDTKSLGGRVRVTRGVVSVKWHEDPDDGYTNRSMAGRVATAADRVRGELKVRGIQPEVQPVVVLWADFAQESILSSRVAWIAGRLLATTLQARPATLSADEINAAAHAFVAALKMRPSRPPRRIRAGRFSNRRVPNHVPKSAILTDRNLL
ncbi:MAG: hypothetical protein QOF83_610 [Solirubrobacteraceae bacterium]|jgi:hypothetical protein|nr:hypothetical protein [Solirubrobacteraceae bacterium]